MIIQSIALLDQLDKDLNTFAMRVREWCVPCVGRSVASPYPPALLTKERGSSLTHSFISASPLLLFIRYCWHFPELRELVKDNYVFARCAAYIQDRTTLSEVRRALMKALACCPLAPDP